MFANIYVHVHASAVLSLFDSHHSCIAEKPWKHLANDTASTFSCHMCTFHGIVKVKSIRMLLRLRAVMPEEAVVTRVSSLRFRVQDSSSGFSARVSAV